MYIYLHIYYKYINVYIYIYIYIYKLIYIYLILCGNKGDKLHIQICFKQNISAIAFFYV